MDISNIAVVTVVMLDIYVSTRYCIRLMRGEIAPRLATWLIFEAGVLMSLGAYFASANHTVMKAALNTTDAVMVTMILSVVLLKQRDMRLRFTRNEQICIAIACIATVAWLLTRTGLVGLVGFQIVMSIAYLPTLESLWQWKAGAPPEPLDKWSINALIAILGVIVDLAGRKDFLALIYPLRALILCVIVVGLIFRWNIRTGRGNRLQEGHTR